jgi:RNA polymerase sigma-70 factor (ECF subfamily)
VTDGQLAVRQRLDELFRATHPRLVVSIFALTGDAREAEDVVQEAFVRAVVHSGKVLGADSPEAWLRRVARNVAHSRWRRKVRLGQLMSRPDPRPASVPDMPEDRLTVHAAIRRLPMRNREVIALHYVADMSVEEIADTLRLSIGTVKSRLHRGRAALRELLQDDLADLFGTTTTTATSELEGIR